MSQELEKRNPCILVVDDDEMLNFLFCSFLESKDFNVLSANSITTAKAILQAQNVIDLILLDYQLGDGVGMDLLQPEVKSTFFNVPPVIMISANDSPEFLEECFAGGVHDYIIKPVNLSLLALKVETLIRAVNLQRIITQQNAELEKFKYEAEREEQVAKFTYEYLLQQNSHQYDGVQLWLKSFAAFSGDMVLVKKSKGGSLYFVLADATGHGLSAAITIMPVVTIFNSMVLKGFHTQQIVTELNRKLLSDTPSDRFVAALVIEVNPFRQEISVWNGGMPSAFWVQDGKVVHEFKSAHMSLGILDDDMFDASVETIRLPDDGFIFACSDGLTEQENNQKEQFSIKRVSASFNEQPQKLLATLAQKLCEHAQTDSYADDISACIIEPKKVFRDGVDSVDVPSLDVGNYKQHGFSWSITLRGSQLKNCDIPPLCNHALQQLGLDQQTCQKVFAVVAEMVSNAIDHGVLGLCSSLKEKQEGFVEYFSERETRMEALSDNDFVNLTLEWNSSQAPNQLSIEVEDSGAGYNPDQIITIEAPAFSGRGNSLIHHLSESVVVFPPGNKIRVIIK